MGTGSIRVVHGPENHAVWIGWRLGNNAARAMIYHGGPVYVAELLRVNCSSTIPTLAITAAANLLLLEMKRILGWRDRILRI